MSGERLDVSGDSYHQIRRQILREINAESALAMPLSEIEAAVARIVAGSVREQRLFLNQIEQRRLTREIVDDMVRLGPLQVLTLVEN